jgi:hypothetical protein
MRPRNLSVPTRSTAVNPNTAPPKRNNRVASHMDMPEPITTTAALMAYVNQLRQGNAIRDTALRNESNYLFTIAHKQHHRHPNAFMLRDNAERSYQAHLQRFGEPPRLVNDHYLKQPWKSPQHFFETIRRDQSQSTHGCTRDRFQDSYSFRQTLQSRPSSNNSAWLEAQARNRVGQMAKLPASHSITQWGRKLLGLDER